MLMAGFILLIDGFRGIRRKEPFVMYNPKIKSIYVWLFTLLFAAIASAETPVRQATATKPASGYHLLKRIEVGGDGGWDYLTVDSAAHRLYVSHGARVVVIDLDKGAVIGEIPDTNGVHGIAI